MTTAPDLIGEPEKAKAADETSQRLREAGSPEAAINTWWLLLIDRVGIGRLCHPDLVGRQDASEQNRVSLSD